LRINMRSWSGKTQEWVSLNMLLPLSHLERRVRSARRPTMLAYAESLRFRRASDGWGDDRRRAWVLDRLRFSVRRAYRETRYYQELFDRIGFDPEADFGFDDYARLPVLEREDVRRAGRDLISDAVPPGQLQRDATGGSSGEPTEIWMGPEERGWRDAAKEHFLERIGAPTGLPAANFWGHHLDPVAGDGLRERFYNFAHNLRWFDCFRQSPEIFEHFHQAFERWRPARINAYASALGYLAEYLQERGYQPTYPTCCFETGAEKLLPHHRETIEKVFGCPVYERYGSRDVGYIAFQMHPLQTLDFEVDWANIFLEPEDDEPESSILITKLHADGMPMLRYRIGDMGRFPEGSVPGSPSFVVHEVTGRDTDRLWLPNGGWISGIQLPHLLKDHPVREFQFLQRPDYSVELSIVPKRSIGEESYGQILNTIASNLPGLPLSIALVEQVPRTKANKWRPVITQVRRQSAGGAQVACEDSV